MAATVAVDGSNHLDVLFENGIPSSAAAPAGFAIAQYDRAGTRLWLKHGLAGYEAAALAAAPSGDIFVAAYAGGSPPAYKNIIRSVVGAPFQIVVEPEGALDVGVAGGYPDVTHAALIVLKLGDDGALRWKGSYRGGSGAVGSRIGADVDGNVAFAGYTFSDHAGSRITIAITGMFDGATGKVAWTRGYFSDDATKAGMADLAEDAAGNLYVAAVTEWQDATQDGPCAVIAATYDATGAPLWRKLRR